MKGIWSEVLLSAAPRFFWNNENQYAKLAVVYRQYFPLIPEDLNLAVRLGYQGTILGEDPFYMQSYLISSYSQGVNVEGLGGQKSLRGILRNRIIGDGITYSNIELRWKFWRLRLFNQQLYLALSAFMDNGMVVDPIPINRDKIPDSMNPNRFFDRNHDALHTSVGGGLHLAMNRNFVVAIDYGRALNKNDGTDGVYIGLNFLY